MENRLEWLQNFMDRIRRSETERANPITATLEHLAEKRYDPNSRVGIGVKDPAELPGKIIILKEHPLYFKRQASIYQAESIDGNIKQGAD